MNPWFAVVIAIFTAEPAHLPLQAADDPQLCFFITDYTNYHIPIPCGEQDQYIQEHGAQARILPAAGADLLPIYFGSCPNPIPIGGCQSNRLSTTQETLSGVIYTSEPLGYIYDPAKPRPAGTRVLVQCHESVTKSLGWGARITSEMWNYLVVDEPSEATCYYYWQNGSHPGEVIGYVKPL